ncbi:MAG: ferrous iron transport protein B [Candidatus Sumerlaeia bacterium]
MAIDKSNSPSGKSPSNDLTCVFPQGSKPHPPASVQDSQSRLSQSSLLVSLVGNPNSGKTTVFNNMTGSRQHVGNYPGVTVEKISGKRNWRECSMEVVDLPGSYSLTAWSEEERLARRFILDEKPDVVLDVLDASNLERNLYLAVQLIEMHAPVLLVFNMSDMARVRGFEFDLQRLSDLLGTPIVQTVGSKNAGIDTLLDAIVQYAALEEKAPTPFIDYGPDIEAAIQLISGKLEETHPDLAIHKRRWLALKLLENDGELAEKYGNEALLECMRKQQSHIQSILGDTPEILIADRRYGFISGACQETMRSTVERRHDRSDQIDAVVTHPLLAFPLFFALMYLVFQFTFTLGNPLMNWIEIFFGWLGNTVSGFWPEGSESLLQSLLVDGIIGGVGGVIVFLPNIMLLFLAISFLEDSGYMARAAFIMDQLMHKIGLHGKSFIPMLIGFGCSVPAIMATRILENRRDRMTTIMLIPLMSCGGRLPIYGLLIPAFFPKQWQAPLLWLVYFFGIVLAVTVAFLLRKTLFRGESEPFVMELPPYRIPTLKGAALHMWNRGWLYLKKAGTVILVGSIILWFLSSFPRPATEYDSQITQLKAAGEMEAASDLITKKQALLVSQSFAGRLGKTIEPALESFGADWRVGIGVIGGIAAKEIFVAQLGVVFSVRDAEASVDKLREKLQQDFSALAGFCIIIFCLISTPCVATLAATARETGSAKWAWFQLIGLTAMAWIIASAIYQVGKYFAIGI